MLEQGDKSLTNLLLLANTTSYPDNALCAFYDASVNTACRAPSSEDGPQEDFAAFNATPDLAPSSPSPCCVERMLKPTIDGEHKLTNVDEPLVHGATEQQIFVELEQRMTSVQVCDPATTPTTREKAEASAITERSSTHCNIAEGELVVDLGLFEAEGVFDRDISALRGLPCQSSAQRRLTNVHLPTRSCLLLADVWQPLLSPLALHLCGGLAEPDFAKYDMFLDQHLC
ncbi:Sulfur carrier protein FdhD [Labeo rohita]|uniref:Sulfur carrier protein FdhD n=1 Tax=Labeo rohita TaxID=84645 RepID=A0ABQ8L765_LABRO|nr:Sulfur carrier protein FdhD [Labeo rohita]